MNRVFETVHGSRLYGLSRPDSDYDSYVVATGVKTRQRVNGSDDHTVVNLEDFIKQVSFGVPQALEALYSPYKDVNAGWASFLSSLRPSYFHVLDTYRRTILNFVGGGDDKREVTPKRRQHALRLALNRRTFRNRGVFNPVLSEREAAFVKNVSTDQGATAYAIERLLQS